MGNTLIDRFFEAHHREAVTDRKAAALTVKKGKGPKTCLGLSLQRYDTAALERDSQTSCPKASDLNDSDPSSSFASFDNVYIIPYRSDCHHLYHRHRRRPCKHHRERQKNVDPTAGHHYRQILMHPKAKTTNLLIYIDTLDAAIVTSIC